jgi:hypothetical protein
VCFLIDFGEVIEVEVLSHHISMHFSMIMPLGDRLP